MSSVGAGGGGGGGGILNDGISAADAPDPNAATARLSAAPTQAGTNFLNSMTLPLSPLLLDPLSPLPCARKRSAICRGSDGAVANLSHRCQRTGRFIGLGRAENLSRATAHANAPARMA